MQLAMLLAMGAWWGGACGPAEQVVAPARRVAVRRVVAPDYQVLARQARQAATRHQYSAAFERVSRCLDGPDREREAGRARCLIVATRLVDRAYRYFRGRERYLDDLHDFGKYPKGVDGQGNDKTFILKRARRLAHSIGEVREFGHLSKLQGATLRKEAGQQLRSTRVAVRTMGLYQRMDPDRGPIRTYRYAHQLVRLFPRSAHAAEARYRLLTERGELRLARGNKVFPFYGMRRRRDLEVFLQRHPRGRFALRARWDLAAIYYDLWLLARPAFQRTDDYRSYLKLGGEPVGAAARERYRKAARRLYAVCFAKLAEVRSTYRRPERDYRNALSRAQGQRAQLKQALPPATGFPSTLFPPG